MSIGIKVSKKGFNVKEAKENELIINSDILSPKVFMSGTGKIPGQSTVVITHNLGYAPVYLLYIDLGKNIAFHSTGAAASPKWYIHEALGTPAPTPNFYAYSKDNTLEIKVPGATPGERFSYHYFIFYEGL